MGPVSVHNGPVEPPARKKQKRSHGAEGKAAAVDFIAIDQLPWRGVPFPQNFEDAEGFFGLEEISDVEVAQGEGGIGYKLATTETKGKPKSKEQSHSKGPKRDNSKAEWSGFEDDQPRRTGAHVPSSKTNGGSNPSKGQSAQSSNGGLSQGGFEVLQEVDEDSSDVSQWQVLDLAEETLSSLARLQFTKPTAIQRAVIPEIMKGHDVIGKAPTGSGKTLGFGIPILEHFLAERSRIARSLRDAGASAAIALIISPTRELAHQLSSHIAVLCSGSDGPRLASVTGGLSGHKQERILRTANIVIGTPGRLWELMSGSDALRRKFRAIKFLVLDEADRLLSEGHFKDLAEITHALDPDVQDGDQNEDQVDHDAKGRQTLIFSATFQKDLQRKLAGKGKRLADDLLDQRGSMGYLLKKLKFREAKPKFIDVNPDHQMAENLTERILECAALEKDLFLYAVLLHHAKAPTLVFVNSIGAVRRLVPFLQNLKFPAHALHSHMPQKARLRSIERFSSGSANASILVATDIAARGLDIPSVQLIVHYHVPHAADMYVHRSGRTARAEHSGSSILLCSPDEVQSVKRLVAKVHARAKNVDQKHFFTTVELDSRIISRVKPRVTLSKKITDASLAKEKHSQEDNWLRNAAEELGVDFDSEEFAANQGSQKGRGSGRKKREREARGLGKDELASLRAQLKEQLKTRINVGVSERYLTAGGLNIDGLLQEKEKGLFLGNADFDGLVT